MSTQTRVSIKTRLLAAGAIVLGTLAFGSYASATVIRINFSGVAGSGYADLTVVPTNANNIVYPSNVPLTITNPTTGSFTPAGSADAVAITGVLATGHDTAPGEVLPYDYTLFPIAPDYGDHGGISYDNLFYPGGSPMICLVDGTPAYPFYGGFLDLMGVMFTLDNGDYLDLWSFGVVSPGVLPPFVHGLSYGLKVITPTGDPAAPWAVLPNGFPLAQASIPEPGAIWMFGAALIALLALHRSMESRRRTSLVD